MNNIARLTKSIFIAFIFSIGTVCIISCGGGSGGNDTDNGDISSTADPNVTLEKESGIAGSIIKVSGIDIESCPLSTSEIRVGGQTAPTLLNDKGEILMMLPLFYDEDTRWPAPPSGPQDVEIYCDGKLLTTLPEAMEVTELQPAPGTTESIIADYSQIVADFEEFAALLAPDPGLQQQLFVALLSAMQIRLDGDSTNSLLVMVREIRQDNPEFLSLLDAMHAAGGVHESINSLKKLLADLKTDAIAAASMIPGQIPTAPASSSLPAQFTPSATIKDANYTDVKIIALPDEALAAQMKLYSTLKLFAEQVISDTKATFALISGAASIITNRIPYKEAVDATLHIIDYSFKVLLLSILPGTLEPIELALPQTTLDNSEITQAIISVTAKNIPAPVTLTDLFENLLMILGISGGADIAQSWVNSLEKALQESAKFFLDRLNDGLKSQSYIDYDVDLFTIIPPIQFEAIGFTRELYKLYPDASNIIHPLPEKLEWQADDVNRGKTTIFLETVPQAFGDWMILSNRVTVTVGPIALVAQKSATIPEGDSEIVAVKLSKSPPENQEIYVDAKRSSGDEDISVETGSPLIFNESNWDDYQFFVVTAKEDTDKINGVAYITVSAENMEDRTITASERDNDIINIVTNNDTFSIIEGVSKYTGLKVKLNIEPSVPITVTVTHEDGDKDITVESGGVLGFYDRNWDIYQTVTLAASQDNDLESGVAIFKISTDDPDINDKFVSVIELEPYEYALGIEAATSRHNFSREGDYLYDEIVGIVPLTKQCGPAGMGTVKGSAVLDYFGYGSEMPYYDYEKDEFVVCTIDIIGVAHISVEDNNFICEENPSLNLSLTVKTDYLYINTCPSLPTSSTPNIDEYDGQFVLNLHNDYQFELEEEWEEGIAFGSDYFFAEILEP